MRSAILNAPNNIKIISKEIPSITKGEVLVNIKYAGICGSDVHGYKGDQPFITYPRVMGHELSGVVEKSLSKDFDKNDNVVIDPVFNCGECYACQNGRPNVCKNMKVFGIHIDGGFQEYVKVPKKNVHKVDTSIDLKLATLAEPLSIGFEANYRAKVTSNDIVTVMGLGTIGIMVALVAKHHGAEVIGVDINESSLNLAEKLGITKLINSSKENVQQKINEYTNNEGSPVVIEATGVPSVIQDTLYYASAAGRIVILTLVDEDLPVSISELIKKEIDFLGSRLSNNFIPDSISYIENNLNIIKKLEDHILVNDFENIEKVLNKKTSNDSILKTMIKF